MVNASVFPAAACQQHTRPQNSRRSDLCLRLPTLGCRVLRGVQPWQACHFKAKSKLNTIVWANGNPAAQDIRALSVAKCSRSRLACTRLPSGPAELPNTTSSRLVGALAAFVLASQSLPATAGEIIQGTPRVADGDTLQIDGQRIRLYGFDAPEKAQLCKNGQGADYSCGLQSGEALQSMIGSNPVRCEVRNKDQYGRNVSSCSVLTSKGPIDIGNFMVSNGYAVAYRQYGKDYVAVEDAAHQAHKGMWQGTFEMPADWRKDQKIDKLLAQRGKSLQTTDGPSSSVVAALPQPQGTSDGPANGCKIKGNVNAKGDKIYHMPGSQYYERTQIDIPQGERWFCTERQAKEAGWRSAQ